MPSKKTPIPKTTLLMLSSFKPQLTYKSNYFLKFCLKNKREVEITSSTQSDEIHIYSKMEKKSPHGLHDVRAAQRLQRKQQAESGEHHKTAIQTVQLV